MEREKHATPWIAILGCNILFIGILYPLITATLAVIGSRIELWIKPEAPGNYQLPGFFFQWLQLSYSMPENWVVIVLMGLGGLAFVWKRPVLGLILCILPHTGFQLMQSIFGGFLSGLPLVAVRLFATVTIALCMLGIGKTLRNQYEARI